MKTVFWLFFVWYLVPRNFIRRANADLYSPLALSVKNGQFELSSLKEIENGTKSADEESYFRGALCCPQRDTEKTINAIEKIIRSQEHQDESFSCDEKYEPMMYTMPLFPVFYAKPNSNVTTATVAYDVGYTVFKPEDLPEEEASLLPPLERENYQFFSQLRILFDEEKFLVKQVRYKFIISGQSMESVQSEQYCQEYNIGSEFITQYEVQELIFAYSQRNQNSILKDAALSLDVAGGSSAGNLIHMQTHNTIIIRSLIFEDGGDKPLLFEYLTRQSLIPMLDFEDENLATATCSYFVTAPMWKSVANGPWKKVKHFIRNLAAAVSPFAKLNVISGTYGVLKYHPSAQKYERKELHLLADKLPVPEAFWTLIYYKPPDHGRIPASPYGMIVVTNNIPVPSNSMMKICELVVDCGRFKWEGVIEGLESGSNYCCSFHKRNLEKLQIEIQGVTNSLGTLHLKRFPRGFDSSVDVSKLMYAENDGSLIRSIGSMSVPSS